MNVKWGYHTETSAAKELPRYSYLVMNKPIVSIWLCRVSGVSVEQKNMRLGDACGQLMASGERSLVIGGNRLTDKTGHS